MKLVRTLALGLIGAAALATATFADIKKLVIATDATFPPFEYVENGTLTGFDIELVTALGEKIGAEIEWVTTDFKGLVPGLVARRFDMAVSAIYITDERKQVVDFTDSYYMGGLVVMVQEGNDTIKTPADLAGKNVSVQVGTKSVGYLREHHPAAKLVEVEKNDQMFSLLTTGRVDAAVTGKPAALLFAKANPAVKVLTEQLTNEEYGMATRKDQPEVTKAVNEGIAALRADGTWDRLVAKWFGAN